MTPIFHGLVIDSFIAITAKEQFARHVSSFEGKWVQVIVRKQIVKRSLQQNRWYWGCIIAMLALHCGYDAEEMHDALKMRFLLDRTVNDALPTVRSTTSLSTEEFAAYCEQCRQLAAEMGVNIPDPGMAE